MTLNPIHKVLFVLRSHEVKFLLMGGQACVLYGGAEFSRDTDIVILPDETNLVALNNALNELNAEIIAVPQCTLEYLKKGHAVHYRCHNAETTGIRLDIMSVLRNVDGFEKLWERRTSVELMHDLTLDLLSLPDLVTAKKTQRDKDWPMIRRLVEADFEQYSSAPCEAQVVFWLHETRSPYILRELYNKHAQLFTDLSNKRELLRLLPYCSDEELECALKKEEDSERILDREYWAPLKKELENIRHSRV